MFVSLVRTRFMSSPSRFDSRTAWIRCDVTRGHHVTSDRLPIGILAPTRPIQTFSGIPPKKRDDFIDIPITETGRNFFE